MKEYRLIRIVAYVILITYLLISIFPLLWMISTSFKPLGQVYELPPRWIPRTPNIQNYLDLFYKTKGGSDFGIYIMNTIIVSIITTLICIIFGSSAAYSLSRYAAVKGAGSIMLLIILSRMIAPTALLIPFVVMAKKLGILDTKTLLIICNLYMQLPLFIWMAKGYMDGIPKEIDEAATIDGCNRFQAFYKIILKLASPGLISFSLISFLFTWNDFLFALSLTMTTRSKTLTVGMQDFFSDTTVEWTKVSAAGVISLIPALIFVLFFQKYLVKGLIEGSMKG